MTMILVKDPLRDSVEKASGGKQTVIWTKSGFPSYMNIIPRFSLEDLHATALGTGIHPAFIVKGIEKSEIFIGTYQAVSQDGEAISLPNQIPETSIDFDTARELCLNAGPGFHLMTNWEWSAVALWCIANGHNVRGNTNWGSSHTNPEELGKRCKKSGATLTGSGPDSWRHDGTAHGIADLVGNVWEWVDGLKLKEGKIYMPSDNAFSLPENLWMDTGAYIDMVDGFPRISGSITTRDWDSEKFSDMVVEPGFEVPLALKQSLLCPNAALKTAGRFFAENTEDFEALPLRGGGWVNSSNCGLAALDLSDVRARVSGGVGFRPAFID